MIKMQIQGLEQLQKTLKAMPKRVQNEMGRAMRDEADGVLAKAQELVPRDTGYLASTGEVRDVRKNQHRTDLSVEYGAEYAIYNHENPKVRGYRWLARAFQSRMSGLSRRVADRLAASLKRKR
jgi:hypothetical protein